MDSNSSSDDDSNSNSIGHEPGERAGGRLDDTRS